MNHFTNFIGYLQQIHLKDYSSTLKFDFNIQIFFIYFTTYSQIYKCCLVLNLHIKHSKIENIC